MGDVVDIRERLLKRRMDEATAKAGGYDYVEGMRAERDAELKSVEDECRGHCDKILDDLLDFGIADESVEFSTDFIFMTEALRSLIYRARGFDHFIQEVAERLIEIEYDEETDMVNGKWMLGEDPTIQNYGPEAFTDIEELAKSLVDDEDDDI